MPLKPLSLLFASIAATAQAATPDDPALHGCWRGQQSQMTLADGTQRNTNGDCALEFAEGEYRSRCHSAAGDSDSRSRYEVIGPGRLRNTVISAVPAAATPAGTVSEVRYKVQDDWLIVERDRFPPSPPGKQPAPGKEPVSFKSVSVRMPGKGDDCKPRGDNPLRIGKTPASSLDLTVPVGWQPWLVDPAESKPFAAALGPSFLVGAFVPKGAVTTPPRLYVVVLDDTRSGPVPITSTRFADVRRSFLGQMPEPHVSCDPPGSACGLIRQDGSIVYTELANAKGRVVMVTGFVAGADKVAQDEVRRAVRVFADQVQRDNNAR